MSLAPHQDPAVIDLGQAELAAMRDMTTALVTASLLSDDGFEVVRLTDSASAPSDGARFASMVSSIQALSEAVARELTMGTSEYVIVAAERGHVVQMRIPGQTLVLAALFDTDEMLGKALTVSRRCASRIAAALAAAPSGDGPAPVLDGPAPSHDEPAPVVAGS